MKVQSGSSLSFWNSVIAMKRALRSVWYFKRWQRAASTAVTDHEGPRNLLTMPLVIEAWSDPMKDAKELTPLLRSDDLEIYPIADCFTELLFNVKNGYSPTRNFILF
uniref:Uncharacterized protein n=1 Tax=Arundo donax TaxID=35708 RepID=A0A0A8ZV25_ARUDO